MIFQRFAALLNHHQHHHQVGLVYQCVCAGWCAARSDDGCACGVSANTHPHSSLPPHFNRISATDHIYMRLKSVRVTETNYIIIIIVTCESCDFLLFRVRTAGITGWSCYYTHHEAMTLGFPSIAYMCWRQRHDDDWTRALFGVHSYCTNKYLLYGYGTLLSCTLTLLFGSALVFAPEIILFCCYAYAWQRICCF